MAVNMANVAGAVAAGGAGKLPTKPLQKQPGAMIEKARGMSVGGAAQKPGKPAMQTKPMIQSVPMKPDAPPAPDFKPVGGALQSGGIPGGYQTPPIFGGGGGGLQIMDGGAMVPGAAPGGPPPEMDPMGGPSAPNMAGGGLNPGAGPAGLPPGMQLPPQLQQAVANGMDPQMAFDRAMKNRAGFRDRVMAQQQQQGPPMQGGRFNVARGIRNLSDVYRGGGAQPGGQLPTKPMPGGPMQAQPTMDPNLGMQYGGGAGFRPQFRPGFGNGSHPFNGYDE